jgi:oxalate---CoA ligase
MEGLDFGPAPAGSRTLSQLANPPAANLYELLAFQAHCAPDSVAILAPRRSPLSFGALLDQVGYIRTTLNGCALGRGARVALFAKRGPDTAVAALGIASSATCVPINAAATLAEMEWDLVQVAATAVRQQT